MASVPHLTYDRLWQDLSAVGHKVWSARPTVTFVVLLYAAYMVAAKVGEGFSIIPGTDITFWPPAGVMVGMLLVTPRAAWPWLLLTGALGEATANALWFGNPPSHTGLYILGNMLEVSAGALIYAKLAQTPDRVNTLRDSIAFVLSAMAAPIAGATVIASVDAFIAQKHHFAEAWALLWLGDTTGILSTAPLVLVAERVWAARNDLSRLRVIEAVLVIIAALLVFIAAMYGWQQFAYSNLPLLAWLAIRTRFAGAAVAMALLTLAGTIIVSNGMGVFGQDENFLPVRVVFLQSYLGVSALVSLLVAVLAQQYEETLSRLKELNRSLEENVKQRSESLRETDERLQLALEAAESGTWAWDERAQRASWDQRFMEAHGLLPEQPMTIDTWLSAIHPHDRQAVREQFEQFRLVSGAERWEREYRIQHPQSGEKWLLTLGKAERQNGGKLISLKGICLDITFRKTHEERLRMLMRESNHRKKNLLAVVMGIARHTVAYQPEDFLARFQARIHSLAAGYDLLIGNAWRGADLRQLIELQLAHLTDLVGKRIFIEGPKIQVGASISQPLGMALHELATNASKYGALSNSDGEVRIHWELDPPAHPVEATTFRLSWTESKGPPVVKPSRKGYGTAVTGNMIEMAVSGDVRIAYEPQGLTWSMSCPLSRLMEGDGVAPPPDFSH